MNVLVQRPVPRGAVAVDRGSKTRAGCHDTFRSGITDADWLAVKQDADERGLRIGVLVRLLWQSR
jgi:hypothetical protein